MSPQVPVLTTRVLVESGFDKRDLFDGLPFTEAKLYADNSLLSYSEMYAFIRAALGVSQRPWLGLQVGQEHTVSTWGMLGYAMMSCATELEAALLGAQYHEAGSSLLNFQSFFEGDRMRIQMDPLHDQPDLLPFLVESNLCGICAVSSSYLVEPLVPLEVWVTYPETEYRDKYDTYLNCPIKFSQDRNNMWTRAPKEVPLRTSDPVSAQLCLKMVEQIIDQFDDESQLKKDMRRILLQHPGNIPSMDEAAAELAMSVRTLRRRLSELGTSYKTLQEEVRRDLALDYLRNSHLSVDQIAQLVGYTETTNFRRAFRQWTGHAPSHYRQ